MSVYFYSEIFNSKMEEKEHKWWKRTPSLPCLIGGKKSNILQVSIISYFSL